MDVLAHGGRVGHRRHHPVAEVVRVWARESHAANTRDRSDRPQQVREVVLAVVIRVDRLPKERDLRDARRGDLARLPHHVGQSAAPLGATRHRNDAVGALVIAPALHGDPGPHAVEPARREVLVVLLEVELHTRHALTAARSLDERGKRAVAVRPDHQVHVPRPREQLRSEPLRHAPRDAEHRVGPHVALELSKPAEHSLLRVVADGARVDENDVGAVGRLRGGVAVLGQMPVHELGVAHVHLAAVRLDVHRPAGSRFHAESYTGIRAPYR